MFPTLAGYLAPLRAHLVPHHCTAAAFAEIIEVTAGLPTVPTSGFERRLGCDVGNLDLALCVRASDPAAEVLREGGYGGPAIQALLTAVTTPGSPLHERLDTFWLEYDLSRGGRTPSLFASPGSEGPGEAITAATQLLSGVDVEPAVARQLRRLVVEVPGTRLFQVGWMLGRPEPGLRLCFVAHTRPSFERLLDRLTTDGQRERLRDCCDRYADHVTELMIAVDIGAGEIGPRVGLELGFRGAKHEVPLERWSDLLGALEHDGLCTTAERATLLRWPGRMTEANTPAGWPGHLRGAQTLLGPYAMRIDRLLHHVKIVLDHDELVATKIYFGTLQGWSLG